MNFSKRFFLLVILWPLWWIIGIDQFIVSIFCFIEGIIIIFIRRKLKSRLNPVVFFSLLITLWSLLPIYLVESDEWDVFTRKISVLLTQTFLIYLFTNYINSDQDWLRILKGVLALMAYQAFFAFLYLTGIARAEYISLLGNLLPGNLVSRSNFLSSIAYRKLGIISDSILISPYRVSGLSLHPSALSFILIIGIPILVYYLIRFSKSFMLRWILFFILIANFIALVYTQSRTAYVVTMVQLFIFLLLTQTSVKNWSYLIIGLFSIFLTVVLLMISLYVNGVDIFYTFTDLRPESLRVRLLIYQTTIALLKEHPLIGWGYAREIYGISKVFSSGSHNQFLGVLFQNGVIGFFLYVGFWASFWKYIISNLLRNDKDRLFWVLIFCSFFGLHLREVTGNWLWDQSISILVWTVMGLVITKNQILGKLYNDNKRIGDCHIESNVQW